MPKKSATKSTKSRQTLRQREQERVLKRLEKYSKRGFKFDSEISDMISRMQSGEYKPRLSTLKSKFSARSLYEHAELETNEGVLTGSEIRRSGYSFTGKTKTPYEVQKDVEELADRFEEEFYEEPSENYADYHEERGQIIYDRVLYYLLSEPSVKNRKRVFELVQKAQQTIKEELDNVVTEVGFSGLSKRLSLTDEERFNQCVTDLLFPSIDEATITNSISEAMMLLSIPLDFDQLAEIDEAYNEL